MTNEERDVKIIENEARSKSNTHRLDRLEASTDAINRLVTSVEVMATEQKHTTKAVSEVKEDVSALSGKVDAIEQKPAKRWDGLVDKVIYGAVGSLVTAVAAGIIYAIQAAA